MNSETKIPCDWNSVFPVFSGVLKTCIRTGKPVRGKKKINEINETAYRLAISAPCAYFAGMSEDFEPELTDLQARFAQEYILDLNASQAAKRAGSSAKNLAVAGNEFLTNPNVAARIAKLQAERTARTTIDADWLLKRLAEEVNADDLEIRDEEGNFLPMSEWPAHWRKGLVLGYEVDTEYDDEKDDENFKTGKRVAKSRITKIRQADRVRRLELIGRHINVGAFRDNVAVSGPGGGPVEVDVKMSAKEAADAWRRMVDGK